MSEIKPKESVLPKEGDEIELRNGDTHEVIGPAIVISMEKVAGTGIADYVIVQRKVQRTEVETEE